MIIDCGYRTIPYESIVIDTEHNEYTDDWKLVAYTGKNHFTIKDNMSWDEAKWELRFIVDAYKRGEKVYEVKK
jgi:hypothetical protein